MTLLNLAAFCPQTNALGPGLRAAVWVQGCPFRCPGCLAPDWLEFRPAHAIEPAELAERILAAPISGLTFSGGEPMAQASALAELARAVRAERQVDVICFSGYTLAALRGKSAPLGAADLLAEVDVLVDGLYLAERNDGIGLRGSANQTTHYLTDRLRGHDLAGAPRRVEIQIQDGEAFVVGIPPHGLQAALEHARAGLQAGGSA